ncbi:MAG: hypothetical protein EP343_20095 [Deltaproteobacteria bacterium]|nr:MAG: hypothetical protein EP343_20095 [Deltaproteobacteria bacterium]
MFARMVLFLALFVWASLGLNCSGTTTPSDGDSSSEVTSSQESPGSTQDGGSPSEGISVVSNPTYHGHIKALMEKHCNSCHKTGGMGPFPLDSLERLMPMKSAVLSAVTDKRMPPWQADNTCNDYSNDFSMPQHEIDLLSRWVKNGAPVGDPSEYQPPKDKPALQLPRVDLRVKMKEAYTPPENRVDDYRCFLIDWPLKETQFVTGFRVQPGNTETVHHLIVYMADAKDAAAYLQEDANSPGIGYNCYGGPGGGGYPGLLGAWAPGTPATVYPKGTGLRVEPGAKLVLQIHYNVTRKPVKPDLSVIELMLEKKVKQQAMIAPFVDPIWMINKKTMKLPKGQSNIPYEFSADLTTLTGGGTVTVYGAAMHMHMLGKTGTMRIQRKDGEEQCLLRIPRWDFNWQSTFLLQKPIVLNEGDKIFMQCMFDNSAQAQPTVEGKKQKPSDVFWGGGSTDEMCLSFLYITCNDADGKANNCFDF